MDLKSRIEKYFVKKLNLDLLQAKKISKSVIIQEFLEGVKKFTPWLLENQEALISGCSCYIVVVFYAKSEGKICNNLILHFILLYINIDYFLDNPDISKREKKEVRDQCEQILKGETPGKLHYITESALISIRELQKVCLQESILEAFHQEFDPVNKTEHELLEKCIKKCTACVRLIHEIMGIHKDPIYLGACVQLIDDMMDYHSDIIEQNYTVATYHYEHYNNLDKLVYLFVDYLEGIDNLLMQSILAYTLMYFAAVSPLISEDIRNVFIEFYPHKICQLETIPDYSIRENIYKVIKSHLE